MHATARARSRQWTHTVAVAASSAAVLAILSACQAPSSEAAVTEIAVAAASDLRPAFEEIGVAFTAETGVRVTFSFGSSGQLAEQIANGAPFDAFASADPRYVDRVTGAGRADPGSAREFAIGLLAVWSSPTITAPATFEDVASNDYERIVIASPDHAPYGAAAMEALDAAGLTTAVKDRLIYGQSAADAFRIAASGNADIVIAPLSLAIADGGPYIEVPRELYSPLQQTIIVTTGETRADAAAGFAAYLASAGAREILEAYGFIVDHGANEASDG